MFGIPSFTRPPLDLLKFCILYHIALVPSRRVGLPSSRFTRILFCLLSISRNCVSEELRQSNSAQCLEKCQLEHKDKLISSADQLDKTPVKAAAGNNSPTLVSSRNHRNVVQEDEAETLAANAVTFSSPPNAQRIEHSTLEASLSPGVLSSPGREESSQSELETTASDSFSLGSLSPERPIWQHCQFCQEGSPTRGHASKSSQSEGTSSSSSRHSHPSPCMFCHTGEEMGGGKAGGYTLDGTGGESSQYGQKTLPENDKSRDGANSGLPSEHQQFRNMGLCSFDSGDDYFTKNSDVLKKGQRQTQYSPEIPQTKLPSIPAQYTYQEPPCAAGQNRSFAQQGLNDSSCTKNTRLPQEGQKETSYSPENTQLRSTYNNQGPTYFSSQGDRSSIQQILLNDPPRNKNTDLPREVQKQVQYPLEIVEPKQQSMPSQYHSQEPKFFSNQGNRFPAQQGPLGDLSFHKNTGLLKEVEKQTQGPLLNPQVLEQLQPSQYNSQESKYFSNQGNRSFSQHGLLGHPPFHQNTSLPKEVQTQTQHPSERPQLRKQSQPSLYMYNSQEPEYLSINQGSKSFGQQGLLGDIPIHKNTDFPKVGQKETQHTSGNPQMKEQSQPSQYISQDVKYNQGKRSNVQQKPLSDPPIHKQSDFPKEVQKETQHTLGNPQMKEQSQPSQYISQDVKYNQGNSSFVQQKLLADPPAHKHTDFPKEVQKETQLSSGNPQMEEHLQPSQYCSNQGNRFSAQQGSLGDPPIHTKTALKKESKENTQHPSENPHLKEPFQSGHCTNRVANQAFAQQGLMNDPQSFQGHAQAVLADLMALGWQQTGYPRQPIFPPFPPIFQGWNGNPLLLQQLLASRLPFRPPFHAGGNQPRPGIGFGARGTVSHPGRGCRVPLGRAQDPFTRGRPFAPRFHSPGSQNIRTEADSKTFVSGVSSADSLERGDKGQHNTGTDSLQNSTKPPTASPKSTNVESANRKLEPVKICSPGGVEDSNMVPSATEGSPQDSVSREPLGVQSISPGNLREISTKPSATPSPEKAELKRIQRENDRLRQCIDWSRSGGTTDGALSKDKRYCCTPPFFVHTT